MDYEPEEVLGLRFWELTEDPEFTGEAYHDNYIDDRLHVRKLKAKNGEYQNVKWKDKSFPMILLLALVKMSPSNSTFKTNMKILLKT